MHAALSSCPATGAFGAFSSCARLLWPQFSPNSIRTHRAQRQVGTLTEVLLNDAEVDRLAASSEASALRARKGLSIPQFGGPSNRDGVVTSTSFRSRRTAPTRLCPVPALVPVANADAEGHAVARPVKTIMVRSLRECWYHPLVSGVRWMHDKSTVGVLKR